MRHAWRGGPPVFRVQPRQVPRHERCQEETSPMQTVFLEDMAVDTLCASSCGMVAIDLLQGVFTAPSWQSDVRWRLARLMRRSPLGGGALHRLVGRGVGMYRHALACGPSASSSAR